MYKKRMKRESQDCKGALGLVLSIERSMKRRLEPECEECYNLDGIFDVCMY